MKRMRGNILFIILLAVVLFAALSYAVTNSIRGGGKDGGDESSKAAAADILSYATLIENEVTRLMLLGNLDWDQINLSHENYFWTSSPGPYSTNIRGQNPNCIQLTLPQCDLFAYFGGTLNRRSFFEYTTKQYISSSGRPTTGEVEFINQGVINAGTEKPEVIMILVELKSSVCDAINKELGLPLASGVGLIGNFSTIGQRDYWVEQTNTSNYLPSAGTMYTGQKTFCALTSGGYTFFHVIVER